MQIFLTYYLLNKKRWQAEIFGPYLSQLKYHINCKILTLGMTFNAFCS